MLAPMGRRLGVALFFVALGGACSEGVALESGAVEGEYDGAEFRPTFAVALDASDEVLGTTLEIQLGDRPIDCEHHLVVGEGNPEGLYLVIRVGEPVAGVYDAYFEYESLSADGSTQLGGFGTVEITSADEDSIAATLSFELAEAHRPHASASGTIEVRRCPSE